MTTVPDQTVLSERARTLLALHQPGNPVILPTVWDAWSAKTVVDAGFAAGADSVWAVSLLRNASTAEGSPVALPRMRSMARGSTFARPGDFRASAPQPTERLLRASRSRHSPPRILSQSC